MQTLAEAELAVAREKLVAAQLALAAREQEEAAQMEELLGYWRGAWTVR